MNLETSPIAKSHRNQGYQDILPHANRLQPNQGDIPDQQQRILHVHAALGQEHLDDYPSTQHENTSFGEVRQSFSYSCKNQYL